MKDAKNDTARLWQAYRASFQRFASQAALVKSSTTLTNEDELINASLFVTRPRGIDGAFQRSSLQDLELARIAYSEARNRLALALLDTGRGRARSRSARRAAGDAVFAEEMALAAK